jgi:hypothetical protein
MNICCTILWVVGVIGPLIFLGQLYISSVAFNNTFPTACTSDQSCPSAAPYCWDTYCCTTIGGPKSNCGVGNTEEGQEETNQAMICIFWLAIGIPCALCGPKRCFKII